MIELLYDECARCLIGILDEYLDGSPYPFKWRKVNGKWQLFLPCTKMNQEGLDEAYQMIWSKSMYMRVHIPSFKRLPNPEVEWIKDNVEWSGEKYDCYQVFDEEIYKKPKEDKRDV